MKQALISQAMRGLPLIFYSPRALCWLIVALLQDQRIMDAMPMMASYEATFGPHPEGWDLSLLNDADEQERERLSRTLVC